MEESTPRTHPLLPYVALSAFLAVIVGIPLHQAVHEAVKEKETPYVVDFFTQWPTKKHLHGWDQAARDRSIMSKLIRPAFQQLQYDVLGYPGPKAIESKVDGGWLFYTPDVQYLIEAAWDDPRFLHGTLDTLVNGKRINTHLPLHAILKFRDQLKERGIELLLVPVPGKPSIYPDKLNPSLPAEIVSPTESFIREMRNRGLAVVDLFPVLRKARQTETAELYLRYDTHWTPAGLAHAAEAIARQVREYPWFPAEAGRDSAGLPLVERFDLRVVETLRQGDIGEMTKLPERKRIWPEQKVQAEVVMDARTEKPYADLDSSEILFLGDSFSRIYQTDEPKSAGLIAHLARELNQPLASIVNDGGASSLVRQQLYRKARLLKGKKLVIWEFVERDIRFGKDGWEILDLPKIPET